MGGPQHVGGDNEKAASIDDFAWPDQAVPPARGCISRSILPRRMLAARVAVSNENGITAIRSQLPIRLVGEGHLRKDMPALQAEVFQGQTFLLNAHQTSLDAGLCQWCGHPQPRQPA